MSIEDQINSFSKNEMTVLYWMCKGVKYEGIAERLGYSKDWVQLQMSNVYVKLGFEKSMHWTKRRDILKNEVCPRLPKNIDDWKPVISITEGTKEEITEETVANPEMVALVVYDEMAIEKEKEKSLLPPKPKETIIIIDPTKGQKTFRRFVFAIMAAAIISLLGIFAYNLGRGNTRAPQIIVITATPVPVTETPLPTATSAIPTDTPAPASTNTKVPKNTPVPTATAKGYYDEGETVLLADGVYAYINENFQTAGNACWKPQNGFAVIVFIENTSNNPYLIRFDATAFHAKDDLGNEYKLLGSDIFYCEEKVGIIEGQLDDGSKTEIGMQFEGVIPLNATYVDITIDFISGVGPITFRKYIY